MTQIDDQSKLSVEEKRALEQYVRDHPASTLLKDERTAKYIQRTRLRELGEALAQPGEIASEAMQEEKYGGADWTQFDDIARDRPALAKPGVRRSWSALWDALEHFVRSSDASIGEFRSRYTAFFPPWFYGLPCGNDVTPQRDTGLLAWQAWRALLREAWHSGFQLEYAAQLMNIPTTPPGNMRFEIAPVCDAQRAVLAMALESWRARFCPKCGRPFVARLAANKFCSTDCFAEQRREKQRASKRYRARKRKAKAQPRRKAKR